MEFKEDGTAAWKMRMSSKAGPGDTVGTVRKDGYVQTRVLGKTYLVHRLSWLYHNGEWPKGEIDHIDRNPTNNRLENLREATPIENMRNIGANARNTSGVRGVRPVGSTGRWQAGITVSRYVHLGTFDTIEEAAEARAKAEVTYGYKAKNSAEDRPG